MNNSSPLDFFSRTSCVKSKPPSVCEFKDKCIEKTRSKEFGLCDDKNENPPYMGLDRTDKENWGVTVNNPNEKEIQFFAIDYCLPLYKDKLGDENAKRCDCMLRNLTDNKLIFVELKCARGSWYRRGVEQLACTFQNFVSTNGEPSKKGVEFYIVNKRLKEKFFKSDTDLLEDFRKTTNGRRFEVVQSTISL